MFIEGLDGSIKPMVSEYRQDNRDVSFLACKLRQGAWLGEPRQGEEDQKGHDSPASDVEGGEQAEGTPPDSEKSRRSSTGRFNFRIRGTQCAKEQRNLL